MKQYSEKVVAAFLFNDKVVDICKATGLSKNTILKYKKDPVLQQQVAVRRTELISAAVERIATFMLEGVEILQDIVRNPDTAPQVKVNAVQVMFNQYKDWTNTVEVLKRIEALECAEMDENEL